MGRCAKSVKPKDCPHLNGKNKRGSKGKGSRTITEQVKASINGTTYTWNN